MFPSFGLLFLVLSLSCCILQIIFIVYILFVKDFLYIKKIVYPLFLQVIFLFLSVLLLVYSFLCDDFSVLYVYLNSNSNLPLIYKICALWAAHEGSFLLFIFIYNLWTVSFFIFNVNIDSKFLSIIMFILNFLFLIFILFLLFASNPFERIYDNLPIDGVDLNPLLQDIGLVIHPPFLYIGYTGFVIPFAFALSILLMNKVVFFYFKVIYPWVLMPFVFLTLGIVIGSWWAYYELGWGGWWFWDPVENAALIPWLSSIAVIHALSISKVRFGFFRLSLVLSIITFIFCLLGVFLVRSGIINSIHAFSGNNRGIYLVLILLFVFIISLYIYIVNNKFIYKKIVITFFSKESILFLNIIFLCVVIFIVLLGTYYPTFIDLFFNKKISVGSPYFNVTVVPILCLVFLFIPFGFFLKWVKFISFDKNILYILFFSIIIGFLVSYSYNKDIILFNIFGISLGIWIILGCFYYIFDKSFLKYGFFWFLNKSCTVFSHISVGLIVIGITISSFCSIEKDLVVKSNEKISILNYDFFMTRSFKKEGFNYISDIIEFTVKYNDKILTIMYPEKRLFYASGILMTEVFIYPTFFYDLYIALGKNIDDDCWSCRIYYKPLIRWIWLGGIILSLSVLLKTFILFRRLWR